MGLTPRNELKKFWAQLRFRGSEKTIAATAQPVACEPWRHNGGWPIIPPPSDGFTLGTQLSTVLAMLRKPPMPQIVVGSGLPLGPVWPSAKKRSRRVPVLATAMALIVASSSAALLICIGEVQIAANQAFVEAVRQSPGLTT